ncbi:ABC transporter G family member 17-like [Fagus crenata]
MSKPDDEGNKKAFSSFDWDGSIRIPQCHMNFETTSLDCVTSLDRGGETVIDIGKPVNFTGGLEFTSLTYTVTKKKKNNEGKWLKEEVDLLNRITGYAPKGCITAVMGPSGAGKSTLLDGLAGRIASGSLKGRLSLDGKEMSPSLIKRTSAYI